MRHYIPCETQISFKQYNPNKPAKYGLLFKAINAARYPYTFIASPYCGKPQEVGGIYYVSGTEEIVKYMVEQLRNKVSLNGRKHIFRSVVHITQHCDLAVREEHYLRWYNANQPQRDSK